MKDLREDLHVLAGLAAAAWCQWQFMARFPDALLDGDGVQLAACGACFLFISVTLFIVEREEIRRESVHEARRAVAREERIDG